MRIAETIEDLPIGTAISWDGLDIGIVCKHGIYPSGDRFIEVLYTDGSRVSYHRQEIEIGNFLILRLES